MYQNSNTYFDNEYNVLDNGGGTNVVSGGNGVGGDYYYKVNEQVTDDISTILQQNNQISQRQLITGQQQQQQQPSQLMYNTQQQNQTSNQVVTNFNSPINNNNNNNNNTTTNNIVGNGVQNDFHSMLMNAQNNIRPPQQQTIVQNQYQNQNIYKQQEYYNNNSNGINNNSYGVEESNLLPFSDEKKLILLSALSNDPNLYKQAGLQQIFQQLQPQAQQQQQQHIQQFTNNNFQPQQQTQSNNNNVYNQNFNSVQQTSQLPPSSSILSNVNIAQQQQKHQPQIIQPIRLGTTITMPQPLANQINSLQVQQQQVQQQQQPSPFQIRKTPIPTPITIQASPYSSITPPITPSGSSSSNSINDDYDFDDSNLTDKQKTRRRASQNLASRNYRQRKKQYITEIEGKLEVVILENEKLKNELFKSKKYIESLITEIHGLKGISKIKNKSDIPGCTGEESDEDDLNELLSTTSNSTLVNTNTSPSSSTLLLNTSNNLNNDIEQQNNNNLSSSTHLQPPVNSPVTATIDNSEHDITLLINKLEAGMKISTDPNSVSIPELASTLKSFYDTLKSRQNIYVNQIKKIVNPCTQAKLALIEIDINQVGAGCQLQNHISTNNTTTQQQQHNNNQNLHLSSPQQDPNSFMQNTSPPFNDNIPSSPAFISLQDLFPSVWLQEFIKDASVSDDQEIRIRTLRQESSYQHSKLLKDRQFLNKEIREYYQTKVFKHLIKRNKGSGLNMVKMDEDHTTSSSSPVQNNNQSYITELSDLLDSLKENLDQENELLLRAYEQLGMILSPYQEALFITRVYNSLVGDDADDFSNVQMLHGIWDAILVSYDNNRSQTIR